MATIFLPSEEAAVDRKLTSLTASPTAQSVSHAHTLAIKNEKRQYMIIFLNMKRLLFYQLSMPHIFMKCKYPDTKKLFFQSVYFLLIESFILWVDRYGFLPHLDSLLCMSKFFQKLRINGNYINMVTRGFECILIYVL